jgi:hypothetical protein
MALMMAGLVWLLLLPEALWPLIPFEIGLVISVIVLIQYLHRYRWALRGDTAPASHQPQGPHTGVD